MEREIRACFDKNVKVNILASCDYNRNGIVALCESDLFYVVEEVVFEYESEWEVYDFQDKADAEKLYHEIADERRNTPNWAMQAEYDDAHGTINGEDPGIVAMREAG